jgi:CRISPR-associated protein Csb2
MPEPSNDDPLFGCARLWVSRTPYIPTRHTKGGNIADAIVTDLIAECARRTLPRPEVEIVETIVGPRGGLAARARLQFKTAVHGPLLLGRASHFGAGVYGIV